MPRGVSAVPALPVLRPQVSEGLGKLPTEHPNVRHLVPFLIAAAVFEALQLRGQAAL